MKLIGYDGLISRNIYIYREREREREGVFLLLPFCDTHPPPTTYARVV